MVSKQISILASYSVVRLERAIQLYKDLAARLRGNGAWITACAGMIHYFI